MEKLTERQTQILDFIRETVAASGMPPTVAEITAAMGVSSTNGIRGHLQALDRKGAIELIPNASRGIRLLDQPEMEEEQLGLPIVGQVAAGSPILAQEHIEDYCRVDTDTFKPSADYLLRVKGESMRDVGIFDGDFVFVRKQLTANRGEVIIALVGDEATCKYYYPEREHIRLQPANKDMAPILIPKNDWRTTQVLGVVVGVYRRLH